MLKILFQLDDQEIIEANFIAEAANRLDVGEFQIFQLAYFHWYGVDIDPKALEREFFNYLLNDKITHWARKYARDIINLYDQGKIDPEDHNFHRYDSGQLSAGGVPGGIYKISLVIIACIALMVFIILSNNALKKDHDPCNFPPCPWID